MHSYHGETNIAIAYHFIPYHAIVKETVLYAGWVRPTQPQRFYAKIVDFYNNIYNINVRWVYIYNINIRWVGAADTAAAILRIIYRGEL